MNTLLLQLEKKTSDSGSSYEVADLLADGRQLRDILREVERPWAKREGHPKMAGGYAALSADTLFLPSRHLLGEPEPFYDGKVALLDCECGCPGCWPFVARIAVGGSTVTWSDFAQPHRGPESIAGHWTYDALPPFIFDYEQYLSAIKRHG